jgi:O-antigen/teichoic acid export membrane protein
MEAAPYFSILCLAGILYPLNTYNLNILKVKGRSDMHVKQRAINKGYSLVAILCALPFGIYGLLFCQLFLSIVEFLVNSYCSGKLIGYSLKEQLADVLPTIGLSICIGVGIFFLDQYLADSYHILDIVRIVLCSGVYFIMYLGFSNFIRIPAIFDFRQILKNMFSVAIK